MTKEEYIKYLDREIECLERQIEKQKEIENECKLRQCLVIRKNIVSA